MKFYYEEERKDIYIGSNEPLVYPAHFHTDIELVYIVEGTAIAGTDGDKCRLKKGDFFIVFPESIHYYDNCKNMNSTVIIVSTDLFPEYAKIFMTKHPSSSLIQNAPAEALEIIELLESHRKTYPYIVKKGLLLALLGFLLPCLDLTENKSTSRSTLQTLLKYCVQNYKTEISIESVSKALNISPSHISHTFSNKFNISFRSYINMLRLKNSAELIRKTNMSIAEIAFESGFESLRTFNRVFKESYKVTPIEFRKNLSKRPKVDTTEGL